MGHGACNKIFRYTDITVLFCAICYLTGVNSEYNFTKLYSSTQCSYDNITVVYRHLSCFHFYVAVLDFTKQAVFLTRLFQRVQFWVGSRRCSC